MQVGQLYDLTIIYTYFDGSTFEEQYATPQNLGQMANKVQTARERLTKEGNIVKAQYKAVPLDTQE